MRPFLAILIVILVVLGIWFLVDFTLSPDDGVPGDDTDNTTEFTTLNDDLRVREPNPEEAVGSPLTVTGEARGPWFFEGSFGVRLEDADGTVLAQAPAQAQGEWMTENFVPFEADLTFNEPQTESGVLVFEKANPSGLPENAASATMPVQFGVAAQSVQVFFNREDAATCGNVVAVPRAIEETQAVGRAALTELLEGPTQQEREQGYRTSLPEGVEIQSLTVDEGIARVDFNEALDEGVAGSCRVNAIRAQITETLNQFPTVDEVVISVNGETEMILQP